MSKPNRYCYKKTQSIEQFKRIINKYTYYFKDGFVIYKSLTFKKEYIDPIFKSPHFDSKFITMDLETRTIDGKMYPYAVSICDGEDIQFFYLSD